MAEVGIIKISQLVIGKTYCKKDRPYILVNFNNISHKKLCGVFVNCKDLSRTMFEMDRCGANDLPWILLPYGGQ